MFDVLVLGAGKIGSLIACMLAGSGAYRVSLRDLQTEPAQRYFKDGLAGKVDIGTLNARDEQALREHLRQKSYHAVVSALPHYCNVQVAAVVREFDLHYFDLTEDVEVTRGIRQLSGRSQRAFVPQCGLAPGFISIVTQELMSHFSELDTVKMRVGALPVHPSNALKYSLTWSTDGLINEYGNLCYGIEEGVEIPLLPLEGYETIEIDGLLYEAFNTSGGLGSLADLCAGKVKTMNYKTLRYPGHCEKIRFLMFDLKLNDDRDTLKRILENAVPKTKQDVVLIYVSVSGKQQGEFYEENYVKKIYPCQIAGHLWSAIQVTTAAGICSIVDLVLATPERYQGFVPLEHFPLDIVLANRFGKYYA